MSTPKDALGIVTQTEGLSAGWDWKGEYINNLASGDGLERFSQGSATPDTTLVFGGPARFTGIGKDTKKLHPIGLIDGFSLGSSAQLQRLFEIGSNRSFFTRGKTMHQMQIQAMLADQQNLMKVLTQESVTPNLIAGMEDGKYTVNAGGTKAPGVNNFYMNLDSEALGVPFGMLLLFKTKGAQGNVGLRGKILGAAYLEYCMMSNFQFNVQSQSPVIAESLSIEFDRVVPVDLR